MKRLLPKPVNETTGEPSWRWRRIACFVIMAFCFFVIGGIGVLPEAADTRINETIVSSAFWLLGMVFLLYSGFATTQDVAAILTARSGRPYAENVQSVAPPPVEPVTVISDTTTVTGAPVTNTATDKGRPPE